EKLRFYTFDQRVEIPSGQVRTPDASLKKHIAPDQKPGLGRKKRQASRRMSRGEKTIQRRFPKADRFSFFQKKIGRRGRVIGHAHRSRVGNHRLQDAFFEPVKTRGKSVHIVHEFIAEHVVNMAMGIQKQYGSQFLFADKIYQPVFFLTEVTSGVYDDTFPGPVV